jgi:hypothetical protein
MRSHAGRCNQGVDAHVGRRVGSELFRSHMQRPDARAILTRTGYLAPRSRMFAWATCGRRLGRLGRVPIPGGNLAQASKSRSKSLRWWHVGNARRTADRRFRDGFDVGPDAGEARAIRLRGSTQGISFLVQLRSVRKKADHRPL